MCRYIIDGGRKLSGELKIEGSKNAVLPILAASIINPGISVIHNCPNLRDVKLMCDILRELGCRVYLDNETITIDSSNINNFKISEQIAHKMRASIIFLGATLARMKEVYIPTPGGCAIGKRPIDLHIDALKKMQAKIQCEDHCETGGFIHAKADTLTGCEIILDFPSVGATENTMIAATCAEGWTVVKNAAKEPEIVDLQNFLNAMGGNVIGAGSNTIYIEGRSENLHDVEYTVIPDRIVTGTYMAAAAITGGELLLTGTMPGNLAAEIQVFEKSGCKIKVINNTIKIQAPRRLKSPGHIKTQPYPGFPTDMQAQIISLMSVARGKSSMEETVFECRFKHIEELIKMGANIETDPNNCRARVKGIRQLQGAETKAKDLRGGAALIIAALNARGETVVTDQQYIERGYVTIEKKLASVGARIIKV